MVEVRGAGPGEQGEIDEKMRMYSMLQHVGPSMRGVGLVGDGRIQVVVVKGRQRVAQRRRLVAGRGGHAARL